VHHQTFAPSARNSLSAFSMALLLAACGGGGGDDPPATTPISAAADTLTLANGASGQLLTNDRLGSAAATAGSGGNVSFSLTSAAPPAGVTVTDGAVSIGATAVPGTVSLSYRICEAANSGNCATASATVTIPAPPIVAAADTFSLGAGASADVLANDTLGSTPATATSVTAAATGIWPAGINLLTSGVLTVSSGAAGGSYALGYRICQSVALSNCATGTANVTVPSVGTVSGRAVDAASALGVAGVTVRIGSLSAITDSSGAFSIAGVSAADRLTVLFDSTTHAETARIASLASGGTADVQARLLRVGTTASVDVAAGGTVSVAGSTAQVVLPAAGVQRADGSVPTGAMQVRVTPINPASDSSLMPGDFSTVVSGAAQPIESFGALNVTLRDSAGVALNLGSGRTATIRIPVGTRSATTPATIPLFFFDAATGRWVQEGTATLAGTAPNQYYVGTVSHFSTWNADQVMNTVRLTGCVADALGTRIAGARISGDGINYSGTTSATSDTAGNFTIAVRSSSQTTLVAQSGSRLSNTLTATSGTTDSTLGSCLVLADALTGGVTMKLTWGAQPSDLDSYLSTPSGSTVYYGSRGSLSTAPFANLDVDDTSAFGPEVVTVTRLMVGTYKYFVNNYSGQTSRLLSVSGARVELSVPGRAVELFVPPTSGETTSTDWWLLFELDVDASCNITVRRAPSYSATEPSAPPVSTPVYCTR
jgi:hypothetical protein